MESNSAIELITIPYDGGAQVLSVLMMPLDLGPPAVSPPAVSLVMHDPTHNQKMREVDLAAAHHLTRAESRLLYELVGGLSLQEYAAAAGIALNTAKTFLQQLFVKTGQRRQADLLALRDSARAI